MSKSEKIRNFNDILDTFLTQLSPTIGTSYQFYFKKLVKANATMAIQQFIAEVLPYKQKIINKDESYFLNIESEITSSISEEKKESTLSEILRLKDVYKSLEFESQQEVWNYFQALIVLSEEYLTV